MVTTRLTCALMLLLLACRHSTSAPSAPEPKRWTGAPPAAPAGTEAVITYEIPAIGSPVPPLPDELVDLGYKVVVRRDLWLIVLRAPFWVRPYYSPPYIDLADYDQLRVRIGKRTRVEATSSDGRRSTVISSAPDGADPTVSGETMIWDGAEKRLRTVPSTDLLYLPQGKTCQYVAPDEVLVGSTRVPGLDSDFFDPVHSFQPLREVPAIQALLWFKTAGICAEIRGVSCTLYPLVFAPQRDDGQPLRKGQPLTVVLGGVAVTSDNHFRLTLVVKELLEHDICPMPDWLRRPDESAAEPRPPVCGGATRHARAACSARK